MIHSSTIKTCFFHTQKRHVHVTFHISLIPSQLVYLLVVWGVFRLQHIHLGQNSSVRVPMCLLQWFLSSYCRVCSEDWFDRQLVWGLNRSNVAVSRVRDRRVCPTQYFVWSDGIVYTISGDRWQLSKVTSNILTWFLVSVVKPITLVDHLRSGRTELVELL